MPTAGGRELDHDATGGVLDLPVLVDDRRRGDRRIAYLNPEHAEQAGRSVEELVPAAIWSALRELPVGEGLVVDPDGPEVLDFTPAEVDGVLGAPRADSSLLSRRRRADLASRWVLFHKNAEGRPLAPVQNEFGQRFAFAWIDQDAATAALAPGNSLVQVPLVIALRSNPGVTVLLEAGGPAQVVIDEPLREEILAAAEYFPRGYAAFVAALVPEEAARYEAAAHAIVAGLQQSDVAVRGAWVVGYRLERARAQVIVVVDADGDAAWDVALNTIPRMVPPGVASPDAVIRLGEISETYHALIRSTPDLATPR